MSNTIRTIRVKASHPSQGAFVVINATDFNSSVHEMYSEVGISEPDTEQVESKRGRRKSVTTETDAG